MCQVLTHCGFSGVSLDGNCAYIYWGTLLRPTLGQSDEPSDLRGSLSPTSVYSTWQSPGGHSSNYEPGATLLNFSDRANHDEWTPYSVRIPNAVFRIPTTIIFLNLGSAGPALNQHFQSSTQSPDFVRPSVRLSVRQRSASECASASSTQSPNSSCCWDPFGKLSAPETPASQCCWDPFVLLGHPTAGAADNPVATIYNAYLLKWFKFSCTKPFF